MLKLKKTGLGLMSSRVVTVVLLIVLGLVGRSVYREYRSQLNIRQEVKGLQTQYTKLEDQSLELVRQLKYLQSQEFVEREAREKLNMAKKGEHVVLVTRGEDKSLSGENKNQPLKNWQLWIKYFFGDK